jgi:hypothetical protein
LNNIYGLAIFSDANGNIVSRTICKWQKIRYLAVLKKGKLVKRNEYEFS